MDLERLVHKMRASTSHMVSNASNEGPIALNHVSSCNIDKRRVDNELQYSNEISNYLTCLEVITSLTMDKAYKSCMKCSLCG